jgi:hypothetical protein
MSLTNLIPAALRALPRDAVVLFLTRFLRLFAYGALSVVIVFYLVSLGLTTAQVGLLLTLTLAGDIAISLLLTTRADQMGRRRTLIVGAILMAGAGIAFASTHNLLFLIVAGTIGVISPSGNEVGPFLSIEQAALSHVVSAASRTEVFAWYTLAGSVATALGALCGGAASGIVQKASFSASDSHRAVVRSVRLTRRRPCISLLDSLVLDGSARLRARRRLGGEDVPWGGTFALDCFQVVEPVPPGFLRGRFRGAKLCRVLVLFAVRSAARKTRRDFLLGQCARGNFRAARFAPRLAHWTREDHGRDTLAVERAPHPCALDAEPHARCGGAAHPVQHQPDGRSDKTVLHHGGGSSRRTFRPGGITGVARTAGAAISPIFAGLLFSRPALIGVPFFIAGILKIGYDLALYRGFAAVRPPEEADSSEVKVREARIRS